MKSIIIFIILFFLLLSQGCDNTSDLKSKSTLLLKTYLKAVRNNDLEKARSMFFEIENSNITESDFNLHFYKLQKILKSNYADYCNFTFLSSYQQLYTTNEKFANNNLKVSIQIDNSKVYNVLNLVIEPNTFKFKSISGANFLKDIPNMLPVWSFAFLTACALLFNIYVIYKIKKSKMKRKWLKYILIFSFNFPAIFYHSIDGLYINLLGNIFLFGVNFKYFGYEGTYFGFGIPLFALFWLYKIYKLEEEEITKQEIIETLDRFNKEQNNNQ